MKSQFPLHIVGIVIIIIGLILGIISGLLHFRGNWGLIFGCIIGVGGAIAMMGFFQKYR